MCSEIEQYSGIFLIRAAGETGHFPSVWLRPDRRKIHVRYGSSSYVEVNQHPNPGGGAVMSVHITLVAGVLTLTIDGVVHGSPVNVASVCASGCPTSSGAVKELYFCQPDRTYSDVEIRNLHFASPY